MDTLPKIGSRVRYAGSEVTGPCTGTVRHIYKEYTYPEDTDWGNDDDPIPNGLAPYREWHVAVEVDQTPNLWPYVGSNVFAPAVACLEPIA